MYRVMFFDELIKPDSRPVCAVTSNLPSARACADALFPCGYNEVYTSDAAITLLNPIELRVVIIEEVKNENK